MLMLDFRYIPLRLFFQKVIVIFSKGYLFVKICRLFRKMLNWNYDNFRYKEVCL